MSDHVLDLSMSLLIFKSNWHRLTPPYTYYDIHVRLPISVQRNMTDAELKH